MTARSLVLTVLVFGSVALAACVPSDAGRSVTVTNQCGIPVAFVLDGGQPPAAPDEKTADRLGENRSETYSVLVGRDQPIYVWVTDPPAPSPVSVAPRATGAPTVVLSGNPCIATEGP